MSFKYKVAFIGFIGKGYGDFLNSLSIKLKKENTGFEALSFGQHAEALLVDKDYTFDIIDVKYLPELDEVIASPELLTTILNANFYIIWSGYHNMYAQLRNHFDKEKIPYLLSEYTSVDKLFFFDTGLHGERTKVDTSKKLVKSISFTELKKYIRIRYEDPNILNNEFIDYLKSLKIDYKLLLFLGIWDEAAGLNVHVPDEVKKQIFPFYRSTGEAIDALIDTMDDSMMLVIKLHPYDIITDTKKLENIADRNKNIILIEADKKIDMQKLISISDLTITMTSTLSIVAAFNKIPTLLLGNTYLSDSGYAYQLEDKNGLKDLLFLATQRDRWHIKERACEDFFNDFIKNNHTYTIDQGLIDMGAKSVEELQDRILALISKKVVVSWITKTLVFDSLLNACTTLENIIEERDNVIKHQLVMLDEKDSALLALKILIDERELIMNQEKKHLLKFENEIYQIKNSKAWKVIEKYRVLKIIILEKLGVGND